MEISTERLNYASEKKLKACNESMNEWIESDNDDEINLLSRLDDDALKSRDDDFSCSTKEKT